MNIKKRNMLVVLAISLVVLIIGWVMVIEIPKTETPQDEIGEKFANAFNNAADFLHTIHGTDDADASANSLTSEVESSQENTVKKNIGTGLIIIGVAIPLLYFTITKAVEITKNDSQ